MLLLGQAGAATSGRDDRRWPRAGAWHYHILDPRTGRPAETDVLSAAVVAPSAYQAEVAAQVRLILGSVVGMDWLEHRPTLAVLLVLESGQVIRSRWLTAYLWTGERNESKCDGRHAELGPYRQQLGDVGGGRVLHALIGVVDGGHVPGQRPFRGGQGKRLLQTARESPAAELAGRTSISMAR